MKDLTIHNPAATPPEHQHFSRFIGELQELGRRGKTLQSYTFDWQQFSQWYLSTCRRPFDLRHLSTIDLQDYKSFLARGGAAAATINRRLVFLKRYASFGIQQGHLRRDLHDAFRRIRSARRQALAPRSLPIREVRQLLKELELHGGLRDQAILYLFLYTGLRVGELVRLERGDVSMSERKGEIHIRSEIAKGGRERWLPVPLEARRRLQAYLEGREDDRPELFLGQRGPLREDAVVRVVRKYGRKSALEVTPHLLRHTFAYQFLAKNANDLVGLAAILGHENLNTTRIYTQKRLEDLQESAERVEYF